VGFLRVLRFPPTGNVDRVGWDKLLLTDPSTAAVLRARGAKESLRLDQIGLQVTSHLRIRMSGTPPPPPHLSLRVGHALYAFE
jgi:hypothetical protein